jgi:hypothetical protein
MPANNKPAAIQKLRDVLDRALGAENGLRVRVASRGAGVSLRQRLYKVRSIDRDNTLSLYPEGDLRRGTSPYDALVVTVEGDNATGAWVHVSRGADLEVEEL